MPDGDVFGHRIDGCWRSAASALMEDDPDPEEVEREVERGLKLFCRQWLNSEMIYRYAEQLCHLTAESTPSSAAYVNDQISRMSRKGDFGERIVAEAAKGLITGSANLCGGNLQKVAGALVIRACELAANQGFIAPAISGALAQGRFTQSQAIMWSQRLRNRVSLMAQAARIDLKTGAIRLRSTLKTPKTRTADLLHDSLM